MLEYQRRGWSRLWSIAFYSWCLNRSHFSCCAGTPKPRQFCLIQEKTPEKSTGGVMGGKKVWTRCYFQLHLWLETWYTLNIQWQTVPEIQPIANNSCSPWTGKQNKANKEKTPKQATCRGRVPGLCCIYTFSIWLFSLENVSAVRGEGSQQNSLVQCLLRNVVLLPLQHPPRVPQGQRSHCCCVRYWTWPLSALCYNLLGIMGFGCQVCRLQASSFQRQRKLNPATGPVADTLNPIITGHLPNPFFQAAVSYYLVLFSHPQQLKYSCHHCLGYFYHLGWERK